MSNPDYRRGRDASLAGKPFDAAQNLDWQRGWQDTEDNRGLDEEDGDDVGGGCPGFCEDGIVYDCIDGCCVDPESGCDLCGSRCDYCRTRNDKMKDRPDAT